MANDDLPAQPEQQEAAGSSGSQGGTQTATQTLVRPKPAAPRRPWLWNVVLLDSDDHSYEYVILMLGELFAHPVERAFKIAESVDGDGRGVCLTTHKEHAELKRDQILAFGRDPSMSSCKGSMYAVIEPAWSEGEGGGEGDGDASRPPRDDAEQRRPAS